MPEVERKLNELAARKPNENQLLREE